jgi:hypothetical protein
LVTGLAFKVCVVVESSQTTETSWHFDCWAWGIISASGVKVGLHGDDVADVKDDKVMVLTWSSITAKSAAWDCRFIWSVVPHRLMIGTFGVSMH